MHTYKILLTRSMVSGDISYIKEGLNRSVAGRYEFIVPSSFDEETLLQYAEDVDVLMGPLVTPALLGKAKKLKLIQIPWTGMDTFDFKVVDNCTVPVCNTHSNADAVAEMGMALLLDALKKLSYHDRKMRVGNWNRDQQPLDLKSRMLSNQTVCILGVGNIGSRIAKLLAAFGAKVIGVVANAKPREILEHTYLMTEIHAALAHADVVINALPLTDATKELINADLLEAMKDGVVLLNLSRAGIIDEQAVYGGLISGKIGAFASDVWWNAPKRGESASYPSRNNPFWELDNVVMSPHRAGFVENCLPHLDGAIDNLTRLIRGLPLRDVVNLEKQY